MQFHPLGERFLVLMILIVIIIHFNTKAIIMKKREQITHLKDIKRQYVSDVSVL